LCEGVGGGKEGEDEEVDMSGHCETRVIEKKIQSKYRKWKGKCRTFGRKSGDTDAKGREWTRSYLAGDEAELRLWIVLE
jgi:hypothetical protein